MRMHAAFVAAAALAAAGFSQDSASAGDRAAVLLDRMDQARCGGARKDLDREHVLVRGTYDLVVGGPREIKLKGPFTYWFDGERAAEQIDYPEWGNMRRCIDRELAWEDHPAFGATVYRGADADVLRRCLGFERWRGWRTHYASAEYVGEETVDGRKQHALKLLPKAGGAADVWLLDQDTTLPTRIDVELPGAMGVVRMSYSDWRAVDGVLYAHKERGVAGQATGEFVTTSIEHGAAIEQAPFVPPPKVAELIQKGEPGIAGCRIELVRSQPVLSIRLDVLPADLQKQLATALPEVMQFIVAAGAETAGPPFTRYLETERKDGKLAIECGIPVKQPISGKGRIEARELPGGKVAATWHQGSYQELKQSYDRLFAWMKEQGHRPAGAPWEIYWTDPGLEKDPKKWRTQILWPVVPAGN